MKWRAKSASFICRCTQGGLPAKITRRGKRRSVTVTKPKMEVANCRTESFLLSNLKTVPVWCVVVGGHRGQTSGEHVLLLAGPEQEGVPAEGWARAFLKSPTCPVFKVPVYLLASLLTYSLLSTST